MKKHVKKIKKGVTQGAVAAFGGATIHHATSDTALHGMLYDIFHNSFVAAAVAAVFLAVIDIVFTKGD